MSIEALFDEAAAGYDRARRQLVPGLDGFYGAALESVPFGREAEIRVLDLGAGTGLLSSMVAERSRVAGTLVDLSVEMLRVARRRLSVGNGRFEFRNMDYARKPLPEGYDLVVLRSIHHLTHGDKKELFRKIFGPSQRAATSSTRTRYTARRPKRRCSTASGGCGACARRG